ncbi:unnamed protein product, partial [Amoebophrya sp. A25]|eukprot:GSA25T00024132001.1
MELGYPAHESVDDEYERVCYGAGLVRLHEQLAPLRFGDEKVREETEDASLAVWRDRYEKELFFSSKAWIQRTRITLDPDRKEPNIPGSSSSFSNAAVGHSINNYSIIGVEVDDNLQVPTEKVVTCRVLGCDDLFEPGVTFEDCVPRELEVPPRLLFHQASQSSQIVQSP